MAKNFAEIAFTASVKAQQEQHGSRQAYARMEAAERGTVLGAAEAEFIAARDSFYLATVGAHGHPYVQFRGGPPGFLNVLDAQTLAYADFRGNRQYISVGNLHDNNKAALILMDYAQQRRLKIYARIAVRESTEAPEQTARLHDPSYETEVERVMVLHVEAFDWNCPQHITPRFTHAEMHDLNAPLYARIAQLEAAIARLQNA